MDAIVPKDNKKINKKNSVSREEAEKAVKTLIKWAGDDPAREGLRETPKRVVNAFNEFFVGYKESPENVLSKTFNDVHGYDDIVMLTDISIHSHSHNIHMNSNHLDFFI